MNLPRAIAWNMILSVVGRVVTALINILVFAILARYLGAEGLGHYRTVIVYLGLVATLSSLGLEMITLREISREGADQSRILGNALCLRLVTAVLVLLGAPAVSLLFPYEDVVRTGILAGAAGFVALMGNRLVARLFQEKLRQGQAALAEVLGAGVMLGLVWSLADHGAGVVAMVGAMVAGQVTTLAVSWLFANRLVPFRLRFDLDVWRRLTLAGLPIGGSMILNGITFHGDTLLLSIFQPAADVGVYGLAFKILETVIVIVTMFTGLMMPFLSRYASVDRDRFQAYLSGAFDTLTTGAVGVVVIVFHFAGDLVRLLGGTEFDTAAPALRILGLAMLLVSMASIFRAAVTALDRQKQMFWGDAVAAALALIVYSLLIPRFSFIGAAWGKVLAELATLVFAVAIVGRTVGWLPSPKTAAKALAAGALTLGAIKLLQLAGVPWVANLLVGCIVYVTVLLLGGAISREFLRTLLGDRVAEP